MKLVVAIKAPKASQARQIVAEQPCEVVKSRLETQDPALRNLVDGLCARGLPRESDGAALHWFLIDTDRTVHEWLAVAAVAVCFSAAWLRQQALQIRYLKGVAYCDAAAAWADFLPSEGRADVVVQQGVGVDWAGQPLMAAAASAAPVDVTASAAPEATVKPAGVAPVAKSDVEVPAKSRPRQLRARRPDAPGGDRAANAVSKADAKPERQPVSKPTAKSKRPTAAPKRAAPDSQPGVARKRGRPRKTLDEEQLDLFV